MSAESKHKRLWMAAGAAILVVATAFVVGRMSVSYPDHEAHDDSAGAATGAAQEYTCSMHPSFRSTNPNDKCPICGMDLIPVSRDDEEDDDSEVPRLRVSRRAMALMEIQTRPVEQRPAIMSVRLFGKLDFDETRLADVVARSEGYIEKLLVNYTWQPVRRGDVVAEIYSPAVVTAMRELLVARTGGAGTLDAARSRLVRLGVTAEQIEEVLVTGDVPRTYRIISPYDGVVQMVDEREGRWIMEGARIVRLADVSNLWVHLEAYETDLAWLKIGQPVQFNVAARPGESFEGKIVYINPALNEATRTITLRAVVPNPDGRLKPGMFVTAQVHAESDEKSLFIPVTAPLITGRRAVVYVQVPDADRPTFEPRDIVLGPRAGDHYIVREGLRPGELVVVNGQFKIDSELQIRGRPSMMQPEGGRPPVHQHGTEMPVERVEADESLAADIGRVISMNFALVEALAGDDAEAARAAGEKGHALLVEISRDELARLTASLEHFGHEGDIARQRRLFETFSDALTDAVRKYGTGPVHPVYRAMCPMVQGRRGYWLQANREIANPYFGASMLRCGEIVEELSSRE